MHVSPLLAPVVTLVAWSIVMFFWLAIVRAPQLRGRTISDGARGVDLEREKPGKTNWPAHNYQHLMEQPTIFYAIVFALVLMGFDHPINVYLASGLCRAEDRAQRHPGHGERRPDRFLVFLLATLCLIGLTTHAAIFLIHHG